MVLQKQILQRLNEIGIALFKERRIPVLFEKILQSAKELTHADGGTIYTVTKGKTLRFEIVVSDTLNFHFGGTSPIPVQFADLPLFLEDGSPNDSLIVAYAVNHKETINIKDAYFEEGFDFSGTQRLDEQTGYRTRSVLTVPMKNHEDEVIAVLQLINPIHPRTGDIFDFSDEDVHLAESLASQAGIAMNNRMLIENFRGLFEALIRVISEAIDEKSPSTGNHGKRVPLIAELIAKAVDEMGEGPLKEVHFSQEDLYELQIASLLHDCGKITTPVHVVEKKEKLEAIIDRVEWIDDRILNAKLQAENHFLTQKINWLQKHALESDPESFKAYEREYQNALAEIEGDKEFIHRCNSELEKITPETKKRMEQIAPRYHLTADEVENLLIPEGNLTQKEREVIEHHVVMTYRMLSQLPFPKELRNVAEIASSHHERIDGKGYPRGLKGSELSVQARILMIADVFEALSAPDRPYRSPATLSQVFKQMEGMVEDGHLDPDIFAVFLKKKAYLPYAHRYLMPEQLDID